MSEVTVTGIDKQLVGQTAAAMRQHRKPEPYNGKGIRYQGEQIIRKHLTVIGIHNYGPTHLDQAIDFLEQTHSRYPYQELVSPPLDLANLAEAVELANTGRWHRVSVQPT